jgi:hypothetical protein
MKLYSPRWTSSMVPQCREEVTRTHAHDSTRCGTPGSRRAPNQRRKNGARGFVFRIVFNWRRQCPIQAHSARCNSLIRRWPRGRLQLPNLDVLAIIGRVPWHNCSKEWDQPDKYNDPRRDSWALFTRFLMRAVNFKITKS